MINASLGQLIRIRRKKLQLTAEDLANKVGIDRTYISKIENHDFLPSPKVLTKLVAQLNDSPHKYMRLYESLKAAKAKKMLKQKIKTLAEKYRHL